jgi:HEPN domain-containing protein
MPAPNPLITLIREWIAKAENDLKNASLALAAGAECPADTVCFHAQQCVEKYLKALLVFQATPFPRTHNIRELQALLPAPLRPNLDGRTEDLLTEYATVRRYPGAGPDPPLSEARKTIAIARRVRREIRRHLPRAALRRAR